MAILLLPGFGVLLAAALGAGIGAGMNINKREQALVPTLMHFHNSNLTAAHLKVLNGIAIYPQGNKEAIFSNGDFNTSGEMIQESSANGVSHGSLSISMENNGEPFKEHGKWIIVDTSDKSEAANDTIEAFKDLQERLKTVGEADVLSLLRAFEIVSSAAQDFSGKIPDDLSP